jgi:hypothetical protein
MLNDAPLELLIVFVYYCDEIFAQARKMIPTLDMNNIVRFYTS